ncbi:amidohydrolase family protein [Synechococcus sp. CBW1004]|uniref:amidohydrolase family protein n=1 Tax=Synechococcus sp. CBW1004 TaxID=1353136 RepID=UPI001E649C56|nr:amidohydrolase family protein [Synechococcus sp. CBW1004]
MVRDAAELIFSGGPILTMESSMPRAEAIAIAGGHILAVGSRAEVMAHAGPDTRHVDLAGRTLLPGFIDAHGHFANALQVVGWANVQRPPAGPVTSIASLQEVLREHVAAHPVAKGGWVIAYGYDVDGLSDGRPLDKADLDALFPENPVMVLHNSNHGAVLKEALIKTGN